MNISSTFGFIIASAILYFGVLHGAKDPTIFLDHHALMLVIGGTISASLIAFPVGQLISLFDFLWFGVILKRRENILRIVDEIRMLGHAYATNKKNISDLKFDHSIFDRRRTPY